ncbi:hypothetical protein [Aneurinibacillus aneurinilyticus]|uniref:hypothetical protein n=1 Tax=Aneurinibacillus aneurinilyticus TaxID=1391 RepID=UPI0023F1AAE1|nr:hypothetical protein [Aneurinibacillus aneurinilyticus]
MALSITDADAYITLNVLSIEDWTDSDEQRKQRMINVASRTLSTKFSKYTIPDNAVYEFAAYLSRMFNDTNVQAQSGVQGFALSGVASFNFKRDIPTELTDMIPKHVLDMINEANPDLPNVGGRRVSWTVL